MKILYGINADLGIVKSNNYQIDNHSGASTPFWVYTFKEDNVVLEQSDIFENEEQAKEEAIKRIQNRTQTIKHKIDELNRELDELLKVQDGINNQSN